MTTYKKFALPVVLVFFLFSWPASAGRSEPDRRARVVLFPFRSAVIASTVNASVKEYSISEGETFAKGSTIVQLDDALYKQHFLKAKAAATFAAEVYQNNQKLAQKGGIGRHELARSKFEYESAEVEMRIAQIYLNACVIKAPFSGRLVEQVASEHEFVRIGESVFAILDDYQLLAVMHLPSSQRKLLEKGQEIKLRIDETGTVYAGTVCEISAQIDPRSRTFEAKVLIDNSDRTLSAGMSGVVVK